MLNSLRDYTEQAPHSKNRQNIVRESRDQIAFPDNLSAGQKSTPYSVHCFRLSRSTNRRLMPRSKSPSRPSRSVTDPQGREIAKHGDFSAAVRISISSTSLFDHGGDPARTREPLLVEAKGPLRSFSLKSGQRQPGQTTGTKSLEVLEVLGSRNRLLLDIVDTGWVERGTGGYYKAPKFSELLPEIGL